MKALVTADDIKKLHRSGQTSLDVTPQCTIITPEARDVAHRLGVKIYVDASSKTTVSSANKNADLKHAESKIKKALEAQLPVGKHNSVLLEQLIRKALSEVDNPSATAKCQREVSDSGVVLVRGASVQLGTFEGAPDKPIGLTDVIGAVDKSSMGAGFMQWEKSRFPWTLTYDEIDVVLEGELHIHCDGKTYVGGPGDVFYIPKGTAIEFSAPDKVRFVYVTYPADWLTEQEST